MSIDSLDAENYATALLGISVLGWGGDVLNPSRKGPIVEAWFSDRPLPEVYNDPLSAELRRLGGIFAKDGRKRSKARKIARQLLKNHDISWSVRQIARDADRTRARDSYRADVIHGVHRSLEVSLQYVLSGLRLAETPSYESIVNAVTGKNPALVDPEPYIDEVANALSNAKYKLAGKNLLNVVDERRARLLEDDPIIPGHEIPDLVNAILEEDRRIAKRIVPVLRAEVPELSRFRRTNISMRLANGENVGSCTYLGGQEYESVIDVGTDINMARPEFAVLAGHEYFHHLTHALNQKLYELGMLGFEATAWPSMSRIGVLAEGIAIERKSIMGIKDGDLGREQRVAEALWRLWYVGCNNISFLHFVEGMPPDVCGTIYRNAYLASPEAENRMIAYLRKAPFKAAAYLPLYYAGMSKLAEIMRYGQKALPVIFGIHGMMDISTAPRKLEQLYGARSYSRGAKS